MPSGDGAEERRAAFVLAALRLSRDPDLLPRLEAALAALDDGRRPRATRRGEHALLRRVRERVAETLAPEDARGWDAERRAEAGEATAERPGLAPPPGTPPRAAEAMRAAGGLVARLDAGEEVEAGAATADGWTVVGRTGLERVAAWLPSDLWALLAPGGAELVFVAAGGGGAQELWDWVRVEAALDYRRGMLGFTERFVRAADAADPGKRAESAAARDAFDREAAARHGTERRGADGVLHLLDGRPVRAEGAVLLGPGGEALAAGVEARRLDGAGGRGAFADEPPPQRLWRDQVWARPLPGGGTWRRSRLRPERDRLAFLDEPAAEGPERGDGAPPGAEKGRTLAGDLYGCGGVRGRAARGAVYARLLHAALENSAWRHPASGAAWAGGRRSAAALVASVVGAGDCLNWAGGGPEGVLDGEVLADLRALGWERAAGP